MNAPSLDAPEARPRSRRRSSKLSVTQRPTKETRKMTRLFTAGALALGSTALLTAGVAFAQAPAPAGPQPFKAGTPLSATNEAGQVVPMSSNVKVYGSFHFAESCTFDPTRNLIVAMNAANPQNVAQNDGFVSLINP